MRFIFLTLDGNHNAALQKAAELLHERHGLRVQLGFYAAASLRNEADWQRLRQDAAQADFIFGARLFGEEWVRPLDALLQNVACPVCIITSNPALIRRTRIGGFDLAQRDEQPGPLAQWIKKLRPQGGSGEAQRQLAILRNLSKILKILPGKARDLHSYISAHQYWLQSSPENLYRLCCMLIERYVTRQRGTLPILDPISYPDTALWHPAAAQPFASLREYEGWRGAGVRIQDSGFRSGAAPAGTQHAASTKMPDGTRRGTVGVLTMRSVVLSENTAHLRALVEALEARGLEARVAYAAGLDMRPAVETFFQHEGQSSVDLLINATGFALVGGPAESKPQAARDLLAKLDVGYLGLIPLAFQRVAEWQNADSGLAPIQLALSVAVPELDGMAEPLIYGGPGADGRSEAIPAQVALAADRIAHRAALRQAPNAAKKVAVVVYNFPPNLGRVGSAAYLDVFASLYTLLQRLAAEGYVVDVPESVDALREALLGGSALLNGCDANVAATLPVADYRRLFPAEAGIEPFWGRAPGDLLNDGRNFFIQGLQLGNVFVGVQPSFGYERDPMRLLMAKDAAPNHAFAAFYTWLQHVFQADAVVHLGTHGALEFMPGKQAGLSADCWPSRLIGALPNFYVYSVNNPSEASIAKRRGAATLISYLVPPLQQAGLYKGLRALKDSLDTYRAAPQPALLDDIRVQAGRLALAQDSYASDDAYLATLGHELLQIEERLIPAGLHQLGHTPEAAELLDLLCLAVQFREVHVENREPRTENREHRAQSREPRTENRELRAQSREPRTENREPRTENRELRAQSREPRTENREHRTQSREPRTENRELRTESKEQRATSESPRPLRPLRLNTTLPALVAAAQGEDYAELTAALAHDSAAQQRRAAIDTIVREALRLFIAEPAADGGGASRYLQHTVGLNVAQLAPIWAYVRDLLDRLAACDEIGGLLHGLAGGFVMPSPSNDVVRNHEVLPTGRNVYSLDPFRVPSTLALANGRRIMDQLVTQLCAANGAWPASIAVVLWGSDNLKSECEGVAQILALIGARPVADELGQISDVALLPLEQLGRPRIDAVVTVSGIFRDLLSHQMQLLDKAFRLAALADEPPELNFIRRHALAQAAELNIPLAEAAQRVFANAPGSYGANVNRLVESGTWDDDTQLSEAFLSRKCFTVGRDGAWRESRALLERALGTVDASFQNIDSFEVGISDIDNYYENLGGISKSVERLRGERRPVLVADAVAVGERLSTLEQMVRLETRSKLLNPKWYEGMLAHGYAGAQEIEARVSNTYGWSATTAAVEPWVYQGVAETFVLDTAMRDRLASLNAQASMGIVRRLLEAHGRGYWPADDETIAALRAIYADLEDRLEGVAVGA